MSDFIIGDIHGCAKTTRKLVEDIIRPSETDRLVFVGDYIDRGPDSKGVVDYVKHLYENENFEVIPLRGNHEQMLLNAIEDPMEFNLWMFNQGDTTLNSYGINPYVEDSFGIMRRFPEDHLEFLKNMPYYYESSSYLAVHAGFDFTLDDYTSDRHIMVWTRKMQVDTSRTGGRSVIHGHTPIPLDWIQSYIDDHDPDINIDNGCKFMEMPGYGNLIAYEPSGREILKQPNIET